MKRVASRVANLTLALAIPLFFFGLVEGCASTWIAVRAALDRTEAPAVRRHDPLLGWVSLPSLSRPDVWGPGRDLHTNARGFRGRAPVDVAVPAGRIRLLCSGDSFAFGEGVGDEDTWCHRLSLLDSRIEAVNLGQPGYGVDQAYLRYREEADLEADLHVFSFIGPDLSRAGSDDFHGFAKPVFRLDAGELALTGVPVPEKIPALRRFLGGLAEGLRVVEFVKRAIKKVLGPRDPGPDDIFERLGPTLDALFAQVAALSKTRGSDVVFVYLPLSSEIAEDGRWRSWVRESFARSGLPLLDLTDALRALPPARAAGNFIREGAPAAGHYSEQGNAWVADVLHEAVRSRLDALGGRRTSTAGPSR